MIKVGGARITAVKADLVKRSVRLTFELNLGDLGPGTQDVLRLWSGEERLLILGLEEMQLGLPGLLQRVPEVDRTAEGG